MLEPSAPQPGDLTINLDEIRTTATANAQRVAELGSWPDYVKPEELLKRIPKMGETAPGFDAGVACSLNLIPEDKQRLSAVLHADYTKEAVVQIRNELKAISFPAIYSLNPDSPTVWWLAASSLCSDSEVDKDGFLDQVEKFRELVADPEKRLQAARQEYGGMHSSFVLRDDGVPFGERDGCIQAAYIDGSPFGIFHSQKYGLYFVGTYEDSLGLEDFQWSNEKDEKGRSKSGPVHGSKQFVKCASEEELQEAVRVVKHQIFILKPRNHYESHLLHASKKEPRNDGSFLIDRVDQAAMIMSTMENTEYDNNNETVTLFVTTLNSYCP